MSGPSSQPITGYQTRARSSRRVSEGSSADGQVGVTYWPFPDDLHPLAPVPDVDGHQAAGVRRLVDAHAGHAVELGVEPGVVVSEEADLRADAQNQVIQPLGFARPTRAPAVPLEDHPGGGVVNQEHVCSPVVDQGIDLVACVVSLPVCLQIPRAASVVGQAQGAFRATNRR